jgi:hypothetical protein
LSQKICQIPTSNLYIDCHNHWICVVLRHLRNVAYFCLSGANENDWTFIGRPFRPQYHANQFPLAVSLIVLNVFSRRGNKQCNVRALAPMILIPDQNPLPGRLAFGLLINERFVPYEVCHLSLSCQSHVSFYLVAEIELLTLLCQSVNLEYIVSFALLNCIN